MRCATSSAVAGARPANANAPASKMSSRAGQIHPTMPMRKGISRSVTLVALFALEAALQAQDRQELRAVRTDVPPQIDGRLTDAAWSVEPLHLGPWMSYNPTRGDVGDERTDVRIAYDDRYIYFAFTCYSRNRSQIRTTVGKRDTVFRDDWVGFSLDSAGTGQTAYHLMVNPSGIQMDAVQTTAGGERVESDFLWYSASQRSEEGYTVEIALPVQSIRFERNVDIAMGVLFWRHVSRAGVSYSWPEMAPGQWVFDRHARLILSDLAPRRLVELLPSVVLPLAQTRASPSAWSAVDGTPDVGVSGKLGITSGVTLDATINPDFSQVESDQFQVQVNQRFPNFFSERRPFFMEGSGLFDVAGAGGDFNLRRAVHTRRIVNPSWGVKVTGTADRLTFGMLESSDIALAPPRDGETGRRTLFSIGRATYSLGKSNYVGAIATDVDHENRHNRVLGVDLSWRPTTTQGVSAMYLRSQTETEGPDTHGAAAQVSYRYDTRRVTVATQVEHYDSHFEMDTAFYSRTGFTNTFTYAELSFYPEALRRLGIIRVRPLAVWRYGVDRLQGGGDEGFVFTGMAFNMNRQGFLRVQTGRGHERWAGRRFRTDERLGVFGGMQVVRSLRAGGFFFPASWSTFYDPLDPFQGRSRSFGTDVTWQPGEHFSQSLELNTVRFDRAEPRTRVFSVSILNLRTVYQFDRRLLGRLLTQFDSSGRRWLFDFLTSYEFVPGTAFHAGYGSIVERRAFEDGRWVPGAGSYLTVDRGLFFKASYLYRF
jgi:hypothetical protein